MATTPYNDFTALAAIGFTPHSKSDEDTYSNKAVNVIILLLI